MNDGSQSPWYTPVSLLVALAFAVLACMAAAQLGVAFLQPPLRQPELAEIVRLAQERLAYLPLVQLAAAGVLLLASLAALLTPRSAWQFLLALLAAVLMLAVGASIAAVQWPVEHFDPRAYVGPQLKALEELALLTGALFWLVWLHLRSGRRLPGSIRFLVIGYLFWALFRLDRLIAPEWLARPLPPMPPQAERIALGLAFLFWFTAFVASVRARPGQWQAWNPDRPPEQRDADGLRQAAVGLRWGSASMLVLFLLIAVNAGATILERFKAPGTFLLPLAALALLSLQWGALAGIAGRMCCSSAPAGLLTRLLLFLSLLLLLVLLLLPIGGYLADLVPDLAWRQQVPAWLPERLQPPAFPPSALDQAAMLALIVASSVGFLIFAIGLARRIQDGRSVRRLGWMTGFLGGLPLLVLPMWAMGPERYLLCVAIIVLGESPMLALVLAGLRRSLLKHIRLTAPAKAEEFLLRGTNRYVAADYAGAIADFTEAIRLEPDNVTAHLNRGAARLTHHDAAGAVEDFTAVLDRDPKAGDAYLNRALAHRQLDATDKAIADLTKAAEVFPDNPQYVMERGQIHLDRGDHAAAVADFTRVIEMDPGQTAAYQARAKAFQALGQTEQATADLQQVHTDNPFA